MDTFIDLLETLYNISVSFSSTFKQCTVMNKQNAGVLTFWGHSVVGITCILHSTILHAVKTVHSTISDLVIAHNSP